jgi:hypothetical protein
MPPRRMILAEAKSDKRKRDGMTGEPPPPAACPRCKKPMTYIRTVWRPFVANVDVWHCELCRQFVRQMATDTKH